MKKDLIERELENIGVICFTEKNNYKPSKENVSKKKIDSNLHYT